MGIAMTFVTKINSVSVGVYLMSKIPMDKDDMTCQ